MGQHLKSLDSGISDENNFITRDETECIGRSLQHKQDNLAFADSSFSGKKTSENIVLQYSKILIEEQDCSLVPLILWSRLAFANERREE